MNPCWVVDKEAGGRVRDVDAEERAALLGAGYKEFRLTCLSPEGTREGTLYDQGLTSAEEFAHHVEKSGLALFGGCSSMEVHRPDGVVTLQLSGRSFAHRRSWNASRQL